MGYIYDLYIDPGHGGTDPGANGFGDKEKDWTLKISKYQYKRLKELGVKVAITRTTDKTLDSDPRTDLIKNKAKYCMSNHFNAFNGDARGVEVIHSVWTDDKLAKRIADAICGVSKLPFRRVFSKQATWTNDNLDYYFIPRETGNTISVIVEYGFIDNKNDHNYYKNESNFYKVAEAVVKEWCEILGKKYVTPGKENEPSKGIHIVEPGDTLWGIAKEHDTTVAVLRRLNDMKGDLIHPGDKIKLPGGSAKPTTIKVGSKVKVKQSAKKYATGQSIPDWVKNKTNTIQQVKTDRVLLKEIVSWVYKKDVE